MPARRTLHVSVEEREARAKPARRTLHVSVVERSTPSNRLNLCENYYNTQPSSAPQHEANTSLYLTAVTLAMQPDQVYTSAEEAESAHHRPRMRVPLRFQWITGKPSGDTTRSPRRDRAAIERSHCIDRLADHVD